MAAKNRIVQFYEKYSDKGKPFTVQHFMEEGLSRRTIYRTLQTFKERGTTKRKDGIGRPAKILTKQKLAWLCRKLVHGKLNNSQTAIASKLKCSQSYICKAIKRNTNLICKRKKSMPFYKERTLQSTQRKARMVYNQSRGMFLILDDEKYFGLSRGNMTCNRFFYQEKGKCIACYSETKV